MANYINYDNNLVDVDKLNSSLADSWDSWATRKYGESKLNKEGVESNAERLAFVDAYNDIMSRGITGSEIRNGKRYLKLNGADPQYTSLGLQRAYQQAAGFILDLMSGLATVKKEEEEIKNKIKIGNGFQSNFSKFLGNRLFGNANWHTNATASNDWLNLDSKDSNNRFYNTDKRQAELAKLLEAYKNELKEEDLDFTDSPFKDYADLTSRIDRAIAALRNPELNDEDKAALNALGFDRNVWLATGRELPYTLPDGSTTTYGEYYDALDLQKAKEDLLKQQVITQANRGVLTRDSGIRAVDAIHNTQGYNNYLANTYGSGLAGFNKMNLRIQALLNKSYNNGKVGGLTPAEKKELGNLIHYVRTNNPKYQNYNLTLEEADELNLHPNLVGNGLQDFVRLPWQTPDGRYTYADKSGNIYYLKPKDLKKLAAPTLNRLKMLDYKNYMSNFGMSSLLQHENQMAAQMNTPINWSNLDEATKNELWAVANDIGAFIDPEAVSGTALALNAARLREKNRPSGLTFEKAADWITAGLGGLPVVGDALSAYKAGSTLIKAANASARIGSAIAAIFSAANADDAWESMKKIYNKGFSSMTPQDILNITYGLMGFAAGWKTINAVNSRPKVTTERLPVLETSKGKIKLSKPEAQKVAKEYKSAKSNKEATEKVLAMEEVKAAAQKGGIDLTGAKLSNASGILRGNKVARKIGIAKSPITHDTVTTGITEGSSNKYFMPGTRLWGIEKALPWLGNKIGNHVGGPKRFWNWFMGNTPKAPVRSSETPTSGTPKASGKPYREETTDFSRYQTNMQKAEQALLNRNSKLKSSNVIDLSKNISGEALLHDGTKFKYELKDGKLSINGAKPERMEDQLAVKKAIAKFINSYNSKTPTTVSRKFSKEYIQSLRDLKKQGFLRYGGPIQNFLKEYNI